jgi:small GTP-binding protein
MAGSPVSLDGIDEIVARVQKRFATKPKVAFAGFGNSGKSSLLNAIFGADVARVSMQTDETKSAQVAERFGIDFMDTPGVGTSRLSLDDVLDLGVLQGQHIILHVLNGAAAVSAEDEKLARAIRGASTRSIVVINKIDLLDEREKTEFLASAVARLGVAENEVMMVSAKRGTGVPALVQRITDCLPSALQAGVCAAVALAPIPVADILVLTPIQMAMVATIGYFHGVEVSADRAGELMGVMGTGVGLREAARQLVKLVPGYGLVVSAGIAFAGTVALGETAHLWFSRQMKVDANDLKELFSRVASKAKQEYSLRSEKESADDRAADERIRSQVEALRAKRAQGAMSEAEFDRAMVEIDRSR